MYSTYISNLDNIEGLGLNSSEIDFLGLVSADKIEVLTEDAELTERLQAVQFPNFNVDVGVVDDLDKSDSQEMAEVRDVFAKVRSSMQPETDEDFDCRTESDCITDGSIQSYTSNFTEETGDDVESKDNVISTESDFETTHLNGLSVSDIKLANSIGGLSSKLVSNSKKALGVTEAVAKNMFSSAEDCETLIDDTK